MQSVLHLRGQRAKGATATRASGRPEQRADDQCLEIQNFEISS